MFEWMAKKLSRAWELGLFGTLQRAGQHVYEHYREWSLGVSTFERLYPYGHDSPALQNPYEPMPYRSIDAAFVRLQIRPEEDVLLDYGCGRGRVLAAAAALPFRSVIGVEFHEELAEAGRANLALVRDRRCSDCTIITCDAAQYAVPPDVSVVVLFNPFLGSILSAVIQHLERSFTASPRQIAVIYMNPASDPDVFEACDWLRLEVELPRPWPDMRFRLYRSMVNNNQ